MICLIKVQGTETIGRNKGNTDIFKVCHPEVFNTNTKYTVLFSQTQQSLIHYLLD